ncbi:WD repeat domain phosphoinositide-interacting protein 2-like [Bolinopsis microptera]|uniref:WD repeat domain phosphoinositide-interacting protein 2-like n=1 Tax=Bolinopsis microptera TaxID=2820187 RepID=UPI00307A0D84
MNLALLQGAGDVVATGLYFVTFNQDATSLAVGTTTGYKLFTLNGHDRFDQTYEFTGEDVCIVERLFSSSLIAMVSLSAPRKLKVCHFKKGTEICNYCYPNTILAVKLNRARLLVVLEEILYIHNIKDMKVLHTIRDTPANPKGIIALSINSDNSYLAYPGSGQIGEVQVFDTLNLDAVTMIPAHDAPLAALSFNSSGSLLATASEKGTVIRIFSIPSGNKLYELRRGIKRCAAIYSLSFSPDDKYLSASSNTETIHIFKLDNTGAPESTAAPAPESQTWGQYLGKALVSTASYLPSQMTDVFTQGRAFAHVKLPSPGLRSVCALTTTGKLLVASSDSYLYVYVIEPDEGGECILSKQHCMLATSDGSCDDVGGELSETVAAEDPGPPSFQTNY